MNMPQLQEKKTAKTASNRTSSIDDLGTPTSNMNSINFQEIWCG